MHLGVYVPGTGAPGADDAEAGLMAADQRGGQRPRHRRAMVPFGVGERDRSGFSSHQIVPSQ
jgi:hypothetical protein